MPKMLKLGSAGMTFEVPVYYELIPQEPGCDPRGVMPTELAAHALWYYYLTASLNLRNESENMVEESDRSRLFPVDRARKLLESISFMYGFQPAQVVRFWDAIDKQRRALGIDQNAELPAAYKFRFN